MITLIINGLILTLLVGAIGYIYLVDLRVRKLLLALRELEPMVGQFSSAVDRTETSLEKLKAAKTATAEDADQKTETGQAGKRSTLKSKQDSDKNNVGWVSLPGKSDLVRSFFETARGQES